MSENILQITEKDHIFKISFNILNSFSKPAFLFKIENKNDQNKIYGKITENKDLMLEQSINGITNKPIKLFNALSSNTLYNVTININKNIIININKNHEIILNSVRFKIDEDCIIVKPNRESKEIGINFLSFDHVKI